MRHSTFRISLIVFLLLLCSTQLHAAPLGVTGQITYFGNQASVADVGLTATGATTETTTTNSTGEFTLQLEEGVWLLQPQPQQSQTRGEVTSLDAAYALQAAAHMRDLTSEQAIACDVTGNGTVSALDAALILQYSVGLIDHFPVADLCGSDWVFVPTTTGNPLTATLIPPEISSGTCLLGGVAFSPLNGPIPPQTFTAIRFGDCTGNWMPPATPTSVPSSTPTATSTPGIPTQTPTATCGQLASVLSTPEVIMTHPDEPDGNGVVQWGRAHFMKVVPTDSGWGIFWLRDKTNDLWDIHAPSTLYYAHVDLNGALNTAPTPILDIHRHDREPLYLVTWRVDHYALLINELTNTDPNNKITYQYYYDLSIDGQLSARVGPIRTDLGNSGGIGDIIPYLTGYMVGIETVCQGSHQCSYAFTLGDHGVNKGRDLNVVEFDGTHSHSPNFMFDGTNIAVISSKDALNSRGGIVSQYITSSGTRITSSTPVIPNHGFLLDNNPKLGWNGDRLGVVWRETQGLTAPLDSSNRMRFATFRRDASTSTLLTDRFLEPSYVPSSLMGRTMSFTTSLSVVPDGWLVSYSHGDATLGGPQATIDHLAVDGTLKETWTPYPLDDYAFSSAAQTLPGYTNRIGIAASHRNGAQVDVVFSILDLATCAQ